MEWDPPDLVDISDPRDVFGHDPRTTPSPESWADFWAQVERLGVWDWTSYAPRGMDGTNWELRLRCGPRSVHAWGNGNAFPPRGGDAGPEFRGFCEAVAQLLGSDELFLWLRDPERYAAQLRSRRR